MLPETPAKGLIFDMDGTIVDNMRYHDDAWEVWYRKYGLPFERATFSARTAAAPMELGSSMAVSARSWRRWFWMTSRPAPMVS